MSNTSIARFPQLIFLNGPVGSGRSTLANGLGNLDSGISIYYHQQPLWGMADLITSRLDEESTPMDFTSKEILDGDIDLIDFTWRQWLDEQEALLKKRFGPDTLTRFAVSTTEQLLQSQDTVIFPQISTPDDYKALTELVPYRDQLLIRLERTGTQWSTGSYIFPDVPSITIRNDETPEDLLSTVLNFLNK